MNETARMQRRNRRGDILFAFGVALALYLAWLLRHVLLLLYVSALFAVVLKPLVSYISALRIGRFRPFRRFGIVVLLLLILGALVAFGFLAVPPVMNDLREFGREMPTRLPQMVDKLKRIPFAGQIDTQDITDRIEGVVTGTVASVLHSLKDWASALFTLAMGFILTVYFSLEGETAYRWALSFFPLSHRARLDGALRRADVRMERWLLGQASLMLILGVASTVTYL